MLKRRVPLGRSPVVAAVSERQHEPGRVAFKALSHGCCEVCGAPGLRLRHHVIKESHIRAAGGWPWDPRVGLWVGIYSCRCHADHHARAKPIPLSMLPEDALAFAVDLLGEHQAAAYLARHYSVG